MYRCPIHGIQLDDVHPMLVHIFQHQIAIESSLTELKELAMTEMANQAHLDADVQAETDALTAVEAEIAGLKAQPAATALDFTALDAATARLKGDAPAAAAPAPVDAPPAPPVA